MATRHTAAPLPLDYELNFNLMIMKSNYIYILFLGLLFLLPSCSLLEPEDDNHSTLSRVYDDPNFAEGLLLRAYTFIPTNDYRFDEPATDDAVSNNYSDSYLRLATGEWSALYDPQNLWTNSNRAIIYINEFLTIVNDVPWKWTNKAVNDLYIRKMTGESYALRGLFKYFLLRNHGGMGEDGRMLGLQIFDEFPIDYEAFSKPRATFAEYVESAYADFNEALKYIPMDYGDRTSLPAGFSELSLEDYNTVFGDYSRQRISGRHVKAMMARLALLEASPAFNPGNDVSLWEKAANYNAELLNDIGGVGGLDPTGHLFYMKTQVTDAHINSGDRMDIPEMLWRRPIYTNRAREENNFPPSLFGNGRINPSQNLVDAFPMKNGYPIDHPESGYNPNSPYSGRDQRLGHYIIYNGSRYKGATIRTGEGGGINALDSVVNSTRTGYYMKKLLRDDVNANPSSTQDQQHYNTHIRYTEIFLNYAEAANEAWGPTGGPHGYSAKEVIAAIRKRAGITQPDNYLNSVSGKDAMRELIHNERRLELCFESFRFWDLRRWKKNLTEPVKGVRISMGGNYSYFTVEERVFDNSYMHYGPIPYNDVVKFGITQNAGW